ncbi:hypothetical protein QCA50_007265 [Cerrena zonata]|uniref:Uncharacterized protein n=1 Tax=Cerrena zonata TaxID=2478898 RepID=A0AAW0G7U9_9APHY
MVSTRSQSARAKLLFTILMEVPLRCPSFLSMVVYSKSWILPVTLTLGTSRLLVSSSASAMRTLSRQQSICIIEISKSLENGSSFSESLTGVKFEELDVYGIFAGSEGMANGILLGICSLTLGIETTGGVMTRLIRRLSP